MRSFACIASASLALFFIGCGQKQDLGGGTGGDGASGSGSGASGSGAQGGGGGGTCLYDGNTHQVGQSFPATDGCNTCECLEDGTVGCTEKACETCGGFPAPNPDVECSDGQYCKMPEGQCGLADGTGVCAPIPMGCDAIFAPVCGCDGVTYGNACEAELAQAPLDHDGACAGDLCGGMDGIVVCGADMYCYFTTGTCKVPDAGGTCQPQPTECEDVLEPVCGCDGTTYGNACEAAAVGVSVDHDGAC